MGKVGRGKMIRWKGWARREDDLGRREINKRRE
jgi:hypothetical protein